MVDCPDKSDFWGRVYQLPFHVSTHCGRESKQELEAASHIFEQRRCTHSNTREHTSTWLLCPLHSSSLRLFQVTLNCVICQSHTNAFFKKFYGAKEMAWWCTHTLRHTHRCMCTHAHIHTDIQTQIQIYIHTVGCVALFLGKPEQISIHPYCVTRKTSW